MNEKLITEILLDIRNAIINSEAIQDFCFQKYTKEIKVFLGADERDLPEINNCPYILLDRGKAKLQNNNTLRVVECDFYIFICIYQADIQDDGKGLIYSGILEIDQLAQLIRQEISKNVVVPIEFVEEEIPSISENAPLRQYPVYFQFEKANIKLRERRDGAWKL